MIGVTYNQMHRLLCEEPSASIGLAGIERNDE
jgi:hypothetical protein